MSSEGGTILVVEDNELVLKLFSDLLEAFGYRTVVTRDGDNAIDLAREHRPELIVMDIQLPTVSGLDVTKWLKEEPDLQHIPVLAVTAFAQRDDERRVRDAGCEGYMSKPIHMMPFIETVQTLIAQAKAA
jgi:two-component system cell cycle response regulator DivK